MSNSKDMYRSIWVQLPMSLLMAAGVTLLTLQTLDQPLNSVWSLLLQPIYTAMLYRRRSFELITLGVLVLLPGFPDQMAAMLLSMDLLLAISVTLIFCPVLFSLMGVQQYRPYA